MADNSKRTDPAVEAHYLTVVRRLPEIMCAASAIACAACVTGGAHADTWRLRYDRRRWLSN